MTGLLVDRRVPAAPDRVWRALTDPDVLARWFWPPRFDATAELEPREGGRLRIASEPAGIGVSGTVSAIEDGRLLETTWHWDGEDGGTRVTVGLTDDGEGGTILTLRHDGFADAAAAREHEQGWNDCLDRLPAVL